MPPIRITAGKLRGRQMPSIPAPLKNRVRPTASKVREAVFNMVDTDGKIFCDLFAGSGLMGFEAFSRGAQSVTWVDRSSSSIKFIKDVAMSLGIHPDRCIQSDAYAFLNTTAWTFDIIYADAPYAQNVTDAIIRTITLQKKLSQTGILILETAKTSNIELIDHTMILYQVKRYGDTKITILRNNQ